MFIKPPSIRLLLFLLFLASAGVSEDNSIDKARRLLAAGSTKSAEALLRKIVESDPRNADTRLMLGTTLAVEGQRAESILQLVEAVKLRPGSATAYNTLGMTLSRFVENDAARQAFEKAIQLDPAMADPHVNLSLILAQSGELDLAAEHLSSAIRIDGHNPKAARAWYLRAKIHSQRSEMEPARADLEQAVRLRPDFAEAWADLGSVRRSLLDEDAALRAFERAVDLNPANATAQFRLGSAYLRSGKLREAIIHLSEALRRDPDNRAALYNLQMAFRKEGRTEEADKAGTRMAELVRADSRASETSLQAAKLNNDGVEMEKHGDLRTALEKYEAALDLDPEHGGFRLNAGLALCRLGRWDEGIAEIREVIRRNPDNAEATRALYIALEQQKK